ncbi:MAG: glycosyltransferase [Bacteroidaceae bacterium]|nr:glycosyltransferase [Bacteroidaceae bacterium]
MEELIQFTTAEYLLLIILATLFLIQICYNFILYVQLHRANKKRKKGTTKRLTTSLAPVSVIITTSDEPTYLQENLPKILEQDYPDYEVIVVNDAANDKSTDILKRMEEKYPHLYHTFVPESARYMSRKKLAQTIGIKASNNDWLLFTEINCVPNSTQWILKMAEHFTDTTEVVLGYSGYNKGQGWQDRKIQFDNLLHAMRYLGMAHIGFPFMGIGRNLAYRKSLFFNTNYFASFMHLKRGEDNLFINRIARRKNTAVEASYEGSVTIQPYRHIRDWKEEKLNYLVTSSFYKGIHQQILGFDTLTRFIFLLLAMFGLVAASITQQWLIVGIIAFLVLIRHTLQMVLFNKTAKDFQEKPIYLLFPLLNLINPFTHIRLKLLKTVRKKADFMRKL